MSRMLRFSLLIAVSVGFFGTSFGQKVFEVTDRVDEQMFEFDLISCFIDSSNALSFDQIKSGKYDSRFHLSTKHRYPNTEKGNYTYWIKLKILPDESSKKDWLFEFYDQTIDKIVAYVPDVDGHYEETEMGDRYVFSSRKFQHKNFTIAYPNRGRDIQVVYFKIQPHELNNLIVLIRSHEQFISYALIEYLFFGLFFGMIVIISLQNVLTFIAFRKARYVYYTLYIICVGLYEAAETGVGYQLFWPDSPSWNQIGFGVLLYLLILFALSFARSFLGLKKIAPKLDRLLLYAIYARSIWFVGAIFLKPSLLVYREIEIIPLSLVFFAGWYVYKQNVLHARYFVLAYGFLFSGFILKTLVNLEIIPFNIVSHYSITIGFLGEMLFLSIALGDKIRLTSVQRDNARREVVKTSQEKERLKDKINKELEQKVQERTLELNEANARLEKQAEEINHFNVQLDLKNRGLQKDVVETMNKRIMKKLVDFDEFKLIFPDGFACQKYLNNLKAGVPYGCGKCGNDKYFESGKRFSRRCTRCGYNESITSGTIFKGLKFPIEKAFYIVYLVLVDDDSLTLDQLSEMIDLRANTARLFQNKVRGVLIGKKINKADLYSHENWRFLLD